MPATTLAGGVPDSFTEGTELSVEDPGADAVVEDVAPVDALLSSKPQPESSAETLKQKTAIPDRISSAFLMAIIPMITL